MRTKNVNVVRFSAVALVALGVSGMDVSEARADGGAPLNPLITEQLADGGVPSNPRITKQLTDGGVPSNPRVVVA